MKSLNAEVFELTKHEIRALFSLEDWLTRLDIKDTAEMRIAEQKSIWIQKWEESLFKQSLFGLAGENPPNSEKVALKRVLAVKDRRKRTLLFCETLVFAPYFNIQERGATRLQEKINETHRERWRKHVFRLAKEAQLDTAALEMWETAYTEATRAIGGRSDTWKKTAFVAVASVALAATGGVAAPAIGGFVGGLMGLFGAAATSAGLAFLGGGAIAAGGFGMAGGTVALIGGGALLGSVGGLTASKFFYMQHRVVLSQLAKLEASLRVIFREIPEFSNLLQQVVESHFNVLNGLKRELASPGLEQNERKRITKTSEYYKEAIKRLNRFRLQFEGIG